MRAPRHRLLVLGTAALTSALTGCADDPPSAIVGLTVTGCSTDEAHGAGIVVEPGLILTAAHVVKGAKEIVVTNGTNSSTATIAAFDPEMDLAYLSVDAEFGAPFPLASNSPRHGLDGATGNAYAFRRGEPVVIPVRVERAITIHTEDIYIKGDTYRPGFLLEAAIQAGDSGGPVIVDGDVIGVIWARSSKNGQRAYAVDPVEAGNTLAEQLRTGVIDPDIDLTRCY
jgi:S1-C subfamily serine protease